MRSCYCLPLLLMVLIVSGCTPSPSAFHHDYASGHYASDIQQCALYARKVSGVRLYGDADSWWQQARLRYRRGHTPHSGAILVLRKTNHMRFGHVAVVKNVVSAREINVTHSNWGNSERSRHIIYDSMRVFDVSAHNDWTVVRFWNDEKNKPGFPYQAYGFIYP